MHVRMSAITVFVSDRNLRVIIINYIVHEEWKTVEFGTTSEHFIYSRLYNIQFTMYIIVLYSIS